MMVINSLHGHFKECLKSKSEIMFTAKHDHSNRTPFKLEMANLGTTLTEWSEELKLDSSYFSRPDAVHQLAQTGFDEEEDDGLIHAIGSDLKYALCGIPGHTMERCHMFISMIKGLDFMKAKPRAVATIQRDHKTFVRHKPRSLLGYSRPRDIKFAPVQLVQLMPMITCRSTLMNTDTFAILRMDPLLMPQMNPPPVNYWYIAALLIPSLSLMTLPRSFSPTWHWPCSKMKAWTHKRMMPSREMLCRAQRFRW
jgi:hypothetical protein